MSSKNRRSEGRRPAVEPAPAASRRAVAPTSPRRRPRRLRQFMAIGGVAVALILAVAIAVFGQAKPTEVADPGNHVLGRADAPVKITEWGDFL